jgi:hypothetical protein
MPASDTVRVIFSGPLRTQDAALKLLQRIAGLANVSDGGGLPLDGPGDEAFIECYVSASSDQDYIVMPLRKLRWRHRSTGRPIGHHRQPDFGDFR